VTSDTTANLCPPTVYTIGAAVFLAVAAPFATHSASSSRPLVGSGYQTGTMELDLITNQARTENGYGSDVNARQAPRLA
jgi:hypothetical protein